MPSETTTPSNFVQKPKTFSELREDILSGRVKAADLSRAYYDRIDQVNERLNIYLSLTKQRALEQATKVDDAARKGDPIGLLGGI